MLNNIWVYKIYPELKTDAWRLALTCKNLFFCYDKFLQLKPNLYKRYQRVNAARKNLATTTIIVLDRLQCHNHVGKYLLIFVRSLTPKSVGLNKYAGPFLHYTLNQWEDTYVSNFELQSTVEFKHHREQVWLLTIFPAETRGYVSLLTENKVWWAINHGIWFAIGYCDGHGHEYWDNNQGWNYCDDINLEHIPGWTQPQLYYMGQPPVRLPRRHLDSMNTTQNHQLKINHPYDIPVELYTSTIEERKLSLDYWLYGQ